MNRLISVIVPVYKTQRYLGKCLDSILAQTYPNIEIVVVNDCSPDGSAEICREYAARHDSIRYVELSQNVGLSGARNAGMRVATGKLLGFVDSDDWVEPEAYETLYGLMERYGTKLASSLYYEVWKRGGEYVPEKLRPDDGFEYLDSTEKMLVYYISRRDIMVTNKLFERSLFEGIEFPEGKVYEDTYVSYRLMERAGSAVVSERYLFDFLKRRGSITHSLNINAFDYIDHVIERYENISKRYAGSEVERLCRKQIFEVLMTLTEEFEPHTMRPDDPVRLKYERIHKEVFDRYSYKDCGFEDRGERLLDALRRDVQSYMISVSMSDGRYRY